MVEATGLEPAASCSQSRHSTKLSYASNCLAIIHSKHIIVKVFVSFICFLEQMVTNKTQQDYSMSPYPPDRFRCEILLSLLGNRSAWCLSYSEEIIQEMRYQRWTFWSAVHVLFCWYTGRCTSGTLSLLSTRLLSFAPHWDAVANQEHCRWMGVQRLRGIGKPWWSNRCHHSLDFVYKKDKAHNGVDTR